MTCTITCFGGKIKSWKYFFLLFIQINSLKWNTGLKYLLLTRKMNVGIYFTEDYFHKHTNITTIYKYY